MLEKLLSGEKKLAVIGMGYVGLPIALEFAKDINVVGFDINETLINNLRLGVDTKNESSKTDFINKKIQFTNEETDLKNIGVFIVTVPTPVTNLKSPDLRPLKLASKTIGERLEKNSIIIYESTVYPGCTEEDCLPILMENTELEYLQDFNIAYSPERINPGDKIHTLTNTIKVVSADTPSCLKKVSDLYKHIIKAGVHEAANIKVAEASKIIENTQRDLNIALMNELSIIFDLLNINTNDVIEAASTKWNFLKFYPGLVGGHCIGVDPYYLTYKAETLGYKPEIILAGRKVNDNLSKHIVKRILNHFKNENKTIGKTKILILGVTFKENVSDIRNSKVIEVIHELKNYNIQVEIYDPLVDVTQLSDTYNLSTINSINKNYDAIIAAVKHDEFLSFTNEYFLTISNPKAILIDIKSIYLGFEGMTYWSL